MALRLRNEHGDLPLVRVLRKKPLTTQRAALIIGGYTFGVTVLAGILIRFVDRKDYGDVGEGLWWAVQTVTTVGYGDVTPQNVGGQVIAAVVMVSGIAFLTVITAAVTAALIEASRRRAQLGHADEPTPAQLAERLDRIEAQLARLAERSGRD